MIKYFQSNYISGAAKKKYIIPGPERWLEGKSACDPSSIPESDKAGVDFFIIPVKKIQG